MCLPSAFSANFVIRRELNGNDDANRFPDQIILLLQMEDNSFCFSFHLFVFRWFHSLISWLNLSSIFLSNVFVSICLLCVWQFVEFCLNEDTATAHHRWAWDVWNVLSSRTIGLALVWTDFVTFASIFINKNWSEYMRCSRIVDYNLTWVNVCVCVRVHDSNVSTYEK